MADELFDAVLSGSMDEKKEAITKVEPTKVIQTKANANKDAGGNTAKSKPKLSIYVGNFPWVSITVCVIEFAFTLHLRQKHVKARIFNYIL